MSVYNNFINKFHMRVSFYSRLAIAMVAAKTVKARDGETSLSQAEMGTDLHTESEIEAQVSAYLQSDLAEADKIDFGQVDDSVSPATLLLQMGFTMAQASKFAEAIAQVGDETGLA